MGGQWPRRPRLLAPTGNIGGPQPHDRVAPKASNTQAWRGINYPQAIYDDETGRWISDAQVAEIDFTAFSSKAQEEQ
ncbi:hypothetical protein BAURA63_03852, partial [Brevibacterium aurantiacum]